MIPQIDLEPVDTPIIELVTENVGIGGSFGSVLQGRVVNNTNETVSEAEVSALFFDSNDEVVEVSVDTFFDEIAPGASHPFSMNFSTSREMSSYRIIARGKR